VHTLVIDGTRFILLPSQMTKFTLMALTTR